MENIDQVRKLYENWIKAWNDKNADVMAGLVHSNANLIGFDGSLMTGPSEVKSVIGQIFKDHPTAEYIVVIKEVRELSKDVVLLRSIVGMLPRGQADINPAVNALQSLVATKTNGVWKIALFQNTPTALHGRPEQVLKMTQELRDELKNVLARRRSN